MAPTLREHSTSECWNCEGPVARTTAVVVPAPFGGKATLTLCQTCYDMVYLPLLLDLADPGEQGGETVLVVEDDPDTLSVVVDCLQEEGFTVTTATNGVEALERACHCVPDAIVLDLCLPVMSGPEFLQAWRRTAPTQPVPIIAMSGLNRDVSADDLGVQAWLPKPFAVDALVHAVAAAVSRGGAHHAPLR